MRIVDADEFIKFLENKSIPDVINSVVDSDGYYVDTECGYSLDKIKEILYDMPIWRCSRNLGSQYVCKMIQDYDREYRHCKECKWYDRNDICGEFCMMAHEGIFAEHEICDDFQMRYFNEQ